MTDLRAVVRRKPDRGSTDARHVEAILDAALVCHVGFVDDGQPFVIPMTFARDDGTLLLHGSPASRLLRHFDGTTEACVEVTILDGLVLARSAFDHSMNYRSVVCFGRPAPIEDLGERAVALDAITDRLVPGRREHLRPMTEKEVRATLVLRMTIEAASAKVRSGPPGDDDEDWDVWVGEVPLRTVAGDPVPAEGWESADIPPHITALGSNPGL
ncbi:MAG: pyridoxamine 5'-phosphate oxidase family protein [Acidimicrobiia bacterium]